jgi:hypothetical protein
MAPLLLLRRRRRDYSCSLFNTDYSDGVGLSAMFRKLLEAWACTAACSLILRRRREPRGGGTRGEEARREGGAKLPTLQARECGEESEGKMERR